MEELDVQSMLAALDRSLVTLPGAARREARSGLLAFYAALHHNSGIVVPAWVLAGQNGDEGSRRPIPATCCAAAPTG